MTNSSGVLAKTIHQPQSVSDTEPPIVVISSPSSGQSFNAGAMTTIIFHATDNIAVVSQNILFSIDGVNFTSIFNGLDKSTTSIDITLPMITTVNGVLRVEAIDAAGNIGFALVKNLLLLPDTQPPIVTIIAPQMDTKLKGNTTFTIIFSSSDNVGIASHEILIAIDGKNFTPFIRGIDGEERSAMVQVPNVKAKAALIRVITTDTAGNTGMADSGAFRIKAVK